MMHATHFRSCRYPGHAVMAPIYGHRRYAPLCRGENPSSYARPFACRANRRCRIDLGGAVAVTGPSSAQSLQTILLRRFGPTGHRGHVWLARGGPVCPGLDCGLRCAEIYASIIIPPIVDGGLLPVFAARGPWAFSISRSCRLFYAIHSSCCLRGDLSL